MEDTSFYSFNNFETRNIDNIVRVGIELFDLYGLGDHINNWIYSCDRTCSANARSKGVSISIENSSGIST